VGKTGTRAGRPALDGAVRSPHGCGLWALTTFDDRSTQMFGYTGQLTLPGYGNMSGIGTPNGAAFISGLRSAGG
jgi:hypothetical protein